MKKIFSFLLILLVCGFTTSASAYNILSGSDLNEIFFQNVELLFDSNGNELDLTDPDVVDPAKRGLKVGDVFMGIINAQNVDVNSVPYWGYDSIDDPNSIDAINVSGIFAQEVVAVDNTTGFVTLANTTKSTFTTSDSGTFDISPYLDAGEMMALYVDTDVDGSFTAYNSNGTVWEDIQSATDSDTGEAWLTAGIVNPVQTGGTDYAYSYATLGSVLGEFSAEAFFGLTVIENNTGFPIFESVNDSDEKLYNTSVEIAFTTHIEENNQYAKGNSPWQIQSNDPAIVQPIPEPATLLLFGIGLLGFASFGRRKRQ